MLPILNPPPSQPPHTIPLGLPSAPAPTPYTKINSKWIKDLNIRPETIKLLGENIGKTLSDIHHSRILYDPPPRILEIKAEINKWDLINLFVSFKNILEPCK